MSDEREAENRVRGVLETLRVDPANPLQTGPIIVDHSSKVAADLRVILASIEALRLDAERLDWLGGAGVVSPSTRFQQAWRDWDGASDFRTAIDRAIKGAE